MAFCQFCGQQLGRWRSIFGPYYHDECRKRAERDQAARKEKEVEQQSALYRKRLQMIEAGEFVNLNPSAEIMLDEGEVCCVLIKGCWSTLFYPRLAGRVMPGHVVRVDGLKKNDLGTLHVTNKRVCFIGKGGAKALPLKKLLQCETCGDVLHLTAEGRASSSYFVIESPQALELTGVAIRKLAAMAKAGQKLIIE